ncbi:MAG: hypothetical protein QXH90_06630 [Candidatus Korarchaeum sp.]
MGGLKEREKNNIRWKVADIVLGKPLNAGILLLVGKSAARKTVERMGND